MNKVNWADRFINFLAVILGVSLAFYITSVSENKKNKKELKEYVSSIVLELEDDIDTYESYQIPYNEEQIEEINGLVEKLLDARSDSLAKFLDVVLNLNAYSPSGNTFESMKASGRLNLIEDLATKTALGNYYVELADESERIGMEQTNYFMKSLLPHLANNFDLTGEIMDDDLRSDFKLRNYLVLYSALIQNKTEKYYGLTESAKELLEKLAKLEKDF